MTFKNVNEKNDVADILTNNCISNTYYQMASNIASKISENSAILQKRFCKKNNVAVIFSDFFRLKCSTGSCGIFNGKTKPLSKIGL